MLQQIIVNNRILKFVRVLFFCFDHKTFVDCIFFKDLVSLYLLQNYLIDFIKNALIKKFDKTEVDARAEF